MARPEEKAQNMMNKWVRMKEESERATTLYSRTQDPKSKKRPHLASMCDNLDDAERFRRQIVREISEGIRKIQNAGMGEHAIRDLNDQINKLLREKFHWNKRIQELGGLNFNAIERRQTEAEGGDDLLMGEGLRGASGYRYFGAARDLPGVKELFAKQAMKQTKRKRGEVYKRITPDYVGLRDEEDGVLLELEQAATKRQREEEEAASHQSISLSHDDEADDETDWDHWDVPSQQEVARSILEQKKKALLDKLTF